MKTLTQHVQTTNAKLANWYSHAKSIFGVIGEGEATIVGDHFIINYIEDGVLRTWSMKFWKGESYEIDYFYKVWMEQGYKSTKPLS